MVLKSMSNILQEKRGRVLEAGWPLGGEIKGTSFLAVFSNSALIKRNSYDFVSLGSLIVTYSTTKNVKKYLKFIEKLQR